MQSRYVLAVCAFALLAAIVSAQRPSAGPPPSNPSIFEKLKETAERLVHESIVGFNAAVTCVKEAGEHCKEQLKGPSNQLINYVRCSVEYLKANKERCKQESEKQ